MLKAQSIMIYAPESYPDLSWLEPHRHHAMTTAAPACFRPRRWLP